MADGQAVQAPTFNPDQPYNVVSGAPAQVNAAAPTQVNAAQPPAFNPNQPYDVVSGKEQPQDSGMGTFGKIFLGPGTALAAPLGEEKQEELAGAQNVLQGNVGQGIHQIIHAETPHVVQGSPIEKLIQQFKPDFRGSLTPEQAQDLHDKDYAGIERPVVDVAQTIDKNQHPVLKALTEAAQSMTSPGNVAVMIGTGGIGMVESPKALAVANRLISAGFSANAVGQAYKNLKSFKEAYDRGDASEALYQLTHAVTSGTMAYLAGTHAAGKPIGESAPSTAAGQAIQERVVEPLTEGVGRAAQATGEAVKGAAGNVAAGVKKGLGIGDDFYTTVKKISPPSKGYAMEYADTLKTAEPQLREVFRQNPDVTTPQEMHDAIDQHIQQTEARLGAKASQFEGKPEAQMTGVEAQVRADLEKAFKENPGQYKPAEQEKAIQTVMDHLLQEGPSDLEGAKTTREPSLAETEGVRQRFNNDTKPVYGANAPSVPAAEAFAKDVAAKSLRQAIDQKFDQLGVKDVKEWRKQEAALIDVRDQIADAQKKADEMGTYNVFESLTKQLGWKTLLGFAAGAGGGVETGLTGALAASGLGAVADYIKDLKTNPIRKVTKASELANQPGPTGAALPKDVGVNPTKATAAPAPGSAVNLPAGQLPSTEAKYTLPSEGVEAKYTLPSSPAMDIPADMRPKGTFSSDIHRHEWGHATVAAAEGFTPTQIISHLHPEIKGEKGTSAATGVTFHGIKTGPEGNWDPETVRNNTGRVVSAVLGGAAADELFNEIPFEMNRHVSGDLKLIKSALKSIGMDDDEIDAEIQKGLSRAKSHLTQPGIGDILKSNAAVREDNLPETHHVSESRMAGYVKELQRIRDENADNRASEGVAENPTRAVGEERQGAQSGRKGETESEVTEAGKGVKYLDNPRAVSMRDAPVYKDNPEYFKQLYGSGQEWYHGTTSDFEDFKHEGVERGTTDWNSRLGTHFAADSSVAQDFAEGRYSGKEGGKVISAKLKIQNPKTYNLEGDMGDDALKSALKNKIVTLDEVRKVKPDFDPNETYHEGNGIINALRSKRNAIGKNFKNDLKSQGYDGIIYGNVVEGGFGNPAAIAFEPEQIERTDKKVSPQKMIEGQGLVYKGKIEGPTPETGVHQFESKEAPGVTMALREDKMTPETIRTKAEAKPAENAIVPEIAKQAAEQVKKGEGFAADMRTGKPTDTGFLVEVMPERRAILDHDVTPKDIQKFYNDNRDLFKAHPELRVGGYKNELNISAHTENQQAAQELAGKLDQRSVWDVTKGEEIPIGGQGRVTHFSGYPFEDRMKDLRRGE